ncbi:hypothetical protein GGR19_002742 [Croceicoccus naphthovorans]|uniref:hypothetical protein n=1 Tax=Croceicoccus naphthovorans TaxID=1348774 RepID=UPI000A8C313D|nr:hypothetical protein [Croceicoccus naphthovorans]MBB3991305.1 hypothetical protein [Croceicoccus naphthovorans]
MIEHHIKPVSGGKPVSPRPIHNATFVPRSRFHCDGRPSERWDGERWVPWDWRNDRELGE